MASSPLDNAGGFLFHHAQPVAFLRSLYGAGHVWMSSTAINRDNVCSASHGRAQLPNLSQALLQALKLQTNLRLHGVL
jgi:hypothetical protein